MSNQLPRSVPYLVLVSSVATACAAWAYGNPKAKRAAALGLLATFAAAFAGSRVLGAPRGGTEGGSSQKVLEGVDSGGRNAKMSSPSANGSSDDAIEQNAEGGDCGTSKTPRRKVQGSAFAVSRMEWEDDSEDRYANRTDGPVLEDQVIENSGAKASSSVRFPDGDQSKEASRRGTTYSYSYVKNRTQERIHRSNYAKDEDRAVQSESRSFRRTSTDRSLFRQSRAEFEHSSTSDANDRATPEKVDLVAVATDSGTHESQVYVYSSPKTEITNMDEPYSGSYPSDGSLQGKKASPERPAGTYVPVPPKQLSVPRLITYVVRAGSSFLSEVILPLFHIASLVWHDTKVRITARKLHPGENPYFYEAGDETWEPAETSFFGDGPPRARHGKGHPEGPHGRDERWMDLSEEEKQVIAAKEAVGNVWSSLQYGLEFLQKKVTGG